MLRLKWEKKHFKTSKEYVICFPVLFQNTEFRAIIFMPTSKGNKNSFGIQILFRQHQENGFPILIYWKALLSLWLPTIQLLTREAMNRILDGLFITNAIKITHQQIGLDRA